MAVLDNAARADVKDKFIRRWFVEAAQTANLTTTEIQTLVNDLDVWLDGNEGSANAAITAAVRTKAGATTKFAALAYVALKRGGLL